MYFWTDLYSTECHNQDYCLFYETIVREPTILLIIGEMNRSNFGRFCFKLKSIAGCKVFNVLNISNFQHKTKTQ